VSLPHAATCAVLRASVPESASKVRPPSNLCPGHLPRQGAAGAYSSGADGFTGRRSTNADLRVANQASVGAGVEDDAETPWEKGFRDGVGGTSWASCIRPTEASAATSVGSSPRRRRHL
jgi:hypothetical protein